MDHFLVSEARLRELTATRQGRVSLAGFNYQAAYAVARLASMLTRHPILELSDFPLRLRYDWGEDLDELCENGRVVFTQCKRIATIGQPAGLASVLQSFAAKWLSVPADQRANVHFRLVCSDTRFRAGGLLTTVADDSRADAKKHFETELGTKPGDKSDRALWQADADAIGHAQLFASLWEKTEVLFLPPDVVTGHPVRPLLHAEREALEDLLTFSEIHPSKQAEALDRLRRIIHGNLIAFDPTNEAELDFPRETPRTRVRADVANALASCQLAAGGRLPFEVVDRTFLSTQRQATRHQFVARQPDWADVVHGADDIVKFVERTITTEALGKIVTELVEPIERGTAHRLHMLFVTGAPGSGKTTLVRRVAAMLVDDGRIVVADAGVDAHEPAGSPEDYAAPLEQLANAGRPVIFLLDDPLFGDSPWIPVLKRLNRPGLKVAVLAPCPQMLFDQHKGSVLPIGVVKDFKIGPPTETERTEMRRLYGRATDALMTADEFLVITMEAAAGLPFDEIMRRLWQTLNDGQPEPGDWNTSSWTLRAFMIVAFFHRAYASCPEPILRVVLDASYGSQPAGDISSELAKLKSRDGWLMFKFGGHERASWAYLGTPVTTAHQRIALRAWELRPLDWVDVGSKVIGASLSAPKSIRQLGALAARLLSHGNEADKSFATQLVDAWSQQGNQAKFETRNLCELVTMLQTGGQREIALRLKPVLMARAQPSNDGWVAALQLCYLSGETIRAQTYPAQLDLTAIISNANFSIAPNRAAQFFSRLPDGAKPQFTKRLLDAFDGALAWQPDSFLICRLFRLAPDEMLERSTQLEAWLKAHPDDTHVRNGYLGLLSKQGLDKGQLDRVITDTEAWFKAHPDDTHVRNGYLGLLSKQELDEEQLDRVVTDTEAWLDAHPDDTHVRHAFLGFLDSKPACGERLQETMRVVEEWLCEHPQDTFTRARFETLKNRGHVTQAPFTLKPRSSPPAVWGQDVERYYEGIERVLAQAWDSVPENTSPENRFKVARRNAEQIVSRLSSHIKTQVLAHFNGENWQSLKARDPQR